jgi:Uma2 family endonuclease
MSAHVQGRLTPEEYLAIERAAPFRSEYYNGRMYAMAGGSHPHAIVISNLVRAIGNLLDDRPCLVTSSDLRVRVEPGGLYAYPDVVVVCGRPRYADDEHDTLLNPLLIIEVLSPSTEAYDRGFKSAQYRGLASLEEYVLVSQTEPRVEMLHRLGADWLLSEYVGLEAVCRLESVGCEVSLAAIYRNVSFESEAPEVAPSNSSGPSPNV